MTARSLVGVLAIVSHPCVAAHVFPQRRLAIEDESLNAVFNDADHNPYLRGRVFAFCWHAICWRARGLGGGATGGVAEDFPGFGVNYVAAAWFAHVLFALLLCVTPVRHLPNLKSMTCTQCVAVRRAVTHNMLWS